jgi:hypothetical protein
VCLENVFVFQTKHRSVPWDWPQGSMAPKDFGWFYDRFQGEIACAHRIRFVPVAPTMEAEEVHPGSRRKVVRHI